MERHVVVVGGGIAGLTAALRLASASAIARPVTVTLLEGSPLLGGKLRTTELAGLPVEEGAESLLARVPEAVALAREVGLGDDIENPATTKAALWTRGTLRPIPARTVMGVPGDLCALADSGVLSPLGSLRVPLDLALPPTPVGDDISVGAYVGARLGREVVDRLVDPLLGGVYAGRADGLSLAATVPALAAAARRERSLLVAARSLAPVPASGADFPVFAGIRGGLGRLAEAVARAAADAGVEIRTGTTVRELHRAAGGGFRLVVGSAAAPETVWADAVVLGIPARPASRLLRTVAPAASVELGEIEYASLALVTAVLSGMTPPGSGFLVPAVDGRMIKAATFLTTKWGWLRDEAAGMVVVRASIGRHGDEAHVQRGDRELVNAALRDLTAAVGPLGEVVASRVSRWGGALPQYAVGHVDRVRRIRSAVAAVPGLAVCGAAYDGVGVPACIRSAQVAVDLVIEALSQRGTIEA